LIHFYKRKRNSQERGHKENKDQKAKELLK